MNAIPQSPIGRWFYLYPPPQPCALTLSGCCFILLFSFHINDLEWTYLGYIPLSLALIYLICRLRIAKRRNNTELDFLKFTEHRADGDRTIKDASISYPTVTNKYDATPGITDNITVGDHAFLLEAQQIITENMENAKFSVCQLSRLLGISQAQLYRKMIKGTGLSPVYFIRRIRLKYAKRLLSGGDNRITIAEVAYRSGFSSPAYFTRIFRKELGLTPSEYREKTLVR